MLVWCSALWSHQFTSRGSVGGAPCLQTSSWKACFSSFWLVKHCCRNPFSLSILSPSSIFCITVHVGYGLELRQYILQYSFWLILVRFSCYRAKGSGSTWASYIQALPEFVFLPLFFTDLVSHILIANLNLYWHSLIWYCLSFVVCTEMIFLPLKLYAFRLFLSTGTNQYSRCVGARGSSMAEEIHRIIISSFNSGRSGWFQVHRIWYSSFKPTFPSRCIGLWDWVWMIEGSC
jgi:hypothetical protein